MYRFHILALLLFMFFGGSSHAQIFSGTSPSIDWKQIDFPGARIIYPAAIDSTAKKIASNIRIINGDAAKTIGGKIKKIPIILRNAGLNSNGYVSLAPFRSEFYLTAPQDPFELGSLPWPDMLTVHEYRHVEQYSNFDVGLSHTIKMIFGQSGQALANAASIPDWFFEGDAVYQETNFTKQGRGSLPSFYEGYRSLWRDRKNYSWMKLRNGSYRDFVPDKYILGFMLTAYGRERSGVMFWEKITHDAASFKSLLYPFQSALKKHSGIEFSDFRDSAFQFFKSQFKDKATSLPSPDYYLDEEFPTFTTEGDIVFMKSSVKSIPAFYIRKNGIDVKIRTADRMTEKYFSYRNGSIVYASSRPDVRWGNRAFSEIQLLDVTTGKQRRITKHTRYFSPDINEEGNKIIAVHLPVSGNPSLHILDVVSGDLFKTIVFNGIINYTHPKIYGDTVISCVTDSLGRMSLMIFNTRNDSSEFLLPLAYNVIGFPVLYHDTLYFTVSIKKNVGLFACTLKDKKIFLVKSGPGSIGKYHAAVKEDTIAWSTVTSQGRRLREKPFSDLIFEEIPLRSYPRVTSSFGLLSINNINSNLIYRSAGTTFNSKKYSTLSQPFNFHSLIPNADDPVYSLSLVGENLLNTIQSEITLSYNKSDHSKTFGANFAYGRWFPVIVGGLNYHLDRRFLREDTFVYYNNIEPFAGFYIPLDFSQGRNFATATFGTNFIYNQTNFQKPFQKRYKDYSYTYLSNYLSFTRQSQKATAQVLPRFGQSVYLNYKFPVSGASGFQWLSTARLFFPGIGLTHSFNFTASYSQKDTLRQINFSNSFPFARGYAAVNTWKMAALQLNYQLPLAYPDWGFANIVYFLRLRGNLFYDQTFATFSQKLQQDFRSAGAEIFFDTKWWNQVPISFGVRYARLLDADIFGPDGNNRWEIILPLNIFDR